MKKFFAMLMVVALCFGLVACGGNSGKKSSAEQPAADTYDIVFLADAGSINDGGFNQGTWEGCNKYAKEAGLKVNYLQPTEESNDARRTILVQACEQWKAKVCIACGFLWEDVLKEQCSKYPDVKFIFIDGTLADIGNLASVAFKEQEVGFLAGYAVVQEGYRNLAFFGGLSVPSVIRFGYGFVWGAEAAAKELGLSEINMNYWYTGNFDPSPEKATTAASWYEGGTEVIFSCGGSIVESAISAAEQGEGRYLIGVDIDESSKSERIITSAMKSITNATYQAITAAIGSGNWAEWGGKVQNLGTAEGGVQLPDDFSRLKNFTKEQYEAIFQKLATDEGGLASGIPTDADYKLPTEIPLEIVKVNYIG